MSASATFIGLGNMGQPMAGNLLRNGVRLAVYNRSNDKAAKLVREGAQLLKSPREAFEKTPIVFSMLANDEALLSITEGPEGILKGARPGGIHISMSTVSPTLSRTLAAKHKDQGIDYIAAPVFGRPDVAAQAALWICIAGRREAKKSVEPLLRFIGKKTYDFGEDPGIPNAVKLSGNLLILSIIEMLAETFAFAEKSEIPLDTFHSFLTDSLFPSPVFKSYGDLIRQRQFSTAGFKMTLGLKDIDLYLRAAEKLRVPSPIAGLLHDRLLTGLANDRGDLDWSAIALTSFEEAGLNPSLV